MRHRLLLASILVVLPHSAPAQSITFDMGRLLSDPDWSTYRLGFARSLTGPIGYTLYGLHAGELSQGQGNLWGPGAELTLFRGGHPGLYLAAGLTGGLAGGDGDRFWGSWTAGLGYELPRLGPLSLGAEGRWRDLRYRGSRSGVEIAARIGLDFSSAPGPAAAPTVQPPLATAGPAPTDASLRTGVERSGVPADRVELVVEVLETATQAMGTPYKWGGTGAADGGFDCSGLIQYAYAEHGIALPRRSVDQAQHGTKVEKRLDALLPGDILTFSNTGGRVTHVGLYLGDGRFIHSASDGVQISLLSPDDVYGRWWWRRWVGARRVV
ncbi:MAG: C40 family peptidase [Gemmatimonadota bacterium]